MVNTFKLDHLHVLIILFHQCIADEYMFYCSVTLCSAYRSFRYILFGQDFFLCLLEHYVCRNIVIDFVRCHVANVQCWYPVLSFKFGISASTFKFMKWIYLVLCTYSCACFKLIFIVSSFLFHWHLMLLHLLCIMSLLVLKIEIHKI